ncbi:MAG: hypothetical protein IT350_06500 [Deltaproteobacteria bacterium]|nr:hypothetical protein [Deltaproteobacteria bacterium]
MKSRTLLGAVLVLSLMSAALWLPACGDDDDDDDDATDPGAGTLEFYANGEEFIRDGFVTKDGWTIGFDHFYVNYVGLTGIQVAETDSALTVPAKHAGHPHNDIPEGSAHLAATGAFWMDLAAGDDRSLITSVDDAPAGNYNYANFEVIRTDEGEYAGRSIVMIGNASKDADTVPFTIRLDEQMVFSACHQEVDDEFAGVVENEGMGSVEITFHSDHIFGDESTLGEEGSVNEGALGFGPIAALAEDGALDLTQSDLAAGLSGDDYLVFIDALRTTGHSGEGHCNYAAYTGE